MAEEKRQITPEQLSMEEPPPRVENLTITVADIIEHVKTEICFRYCKEPDAAMKKAQGDEAVADELLAKECEKCPLNLL